MHSLLTFLYINKLPKKETKIIPFLITSKGIRYLGIRLAKEVQNSYPEDYWELLKGIKKKKKLNSGKTSHVHILQDLMC